MTRLRECSGQAGRIVIMALVMLNLPDSTARAQALGYGRMAGEAAAAYPHGAPGFGSGYSYVDPAVGYGFGGAPGFGLGYGYAYPGYSYAFFANAYPKVTPFVTPTRGPASPLFAPGLPAPSTLSSLTEAYFLSGADGRDIGYGIPPAQPTRRPVVTRRR